MAIQLLPGSYKRVRGAEIENLTEQPTRTYALDLYGGRKRIHNIKEKHVDGREAMLQAIFKILATYLGWHDIYNDQYGFDVEGLIGNNRLAVLGRINHRVREALLADPRIYSVDKLHINTKESARGTYHVDLACTTRFGNINYGTNIYPWSGRG